MTLFYILIMLCGVALAVRLYRKFKNLRRYYYPTSFEFCKEETIYKLKPFMTEYEYRFYNILKQIEFDGKYMVIPQLNLASIVNKVNNDKYYSELFRNIDFAIFTRDLKRILILIELNDKTHNTPKRIDRDLKVQKICDEINVPLIKFYSCYPNEEEYVIARVKNEIEKRLNDLS